MSYSSWDRDQCANRIHGTWLWTLGVGKGLETVAARKGGWGFRERKHRYRRLRGVMAREKSWKRRDFP